MRFTLRPFWKRTDRLGRAGWADSGAMGEPATGEAPIPPGSEPEADADAQARCQQALQVLARRADEPIGLSISVPFCAAHCLFSDRVVHAAQPAEVIDAYVDALADEAALIGARIGSGREVLQLHLGSGTANELSESQLIRLMGALERHWRLPQDAEMSVERDPRRVSRRHLQVLRSLGFRSVSFGVVDLDVEVQQSIGRRNSAALVDDVCGEAREAGVENIRLELMIGLPQQSPVRWRSTLDRVVAMAPDRVSLAAYRHRPQRAPSQHAIEVCQLPDEAACRALWSLAAGVLGDAGYRWIGADQFVLEGDDWLVALQRGRLRHSLVSYTATPPSALIGLGAGAASEIDGHRFWNTASLPDWHAALRAQRLPVARARPAGPDDAHRRRAVEQMLFCQELSAETAQGGLEASYDRLARYAARGLVHVLEDRIVVTAAGRPLLPWLCGELDAAFPPFTAPRWMS